MHASRWLRFACAATTAVLCACHAPAPTSPVTSAGARASGEDVARELQRRYDDTRTDCGSPTEPAVECSGLLLRATQWREGEHSWMAPGRPAGVSFSWLRQDANATGAFYENGFIAHPAQTAAALGLRALTSRCVYYLNAVTSGEQEDRCRVPCDAQGVFTAEQFVDTFPAGTYGCAFRATARADMNDKPADAWMQMVGVRRIYQYAGHNEVIVAPYDDIGAAMPVEAFFYYGSGSIRGLDDAKKDQIDFRDSTGRWVPVILWTPAASIGDRATFSYDEADQAILE